MDLGFADKCRRVKLFVLNADWGWNDHGIGYISIKNVARLGGNALVVRSELDGTLLLENKIQPDTAYCRKSDVVICWSEGLHFDLSLSFQEKSGCDEIWQEICKLQGKDPNVIQKCDVELSQQNLLAQCLPITDVWNESETSPYAFKERKIEEHFPTMISQIADFSSPYNSLLKNIPRNLSTLNFGDEYEFEVLAESKSYDLT